MAKLTVCEGLMKVIWVVCYKFPNTDTLIWLIFSSDMDQQSKNQMFKNVQTTASLYNKHTTLFNVCKYVVVCASPSLEVFKSSMKRLTPAKITNVPGKLYSPWMIASTTQIPGNKIQKFNQDKKQYTHECICLTITLKTRLLFEGGFWLSLELMCVFYASENF